MVVYERKAYTGGKDRASILANMRARKAQLTPVEKPKFTLTDSDTVTGADGFPYQDGILEVTAENMAAVGKKYRNFLLFMTNSDHEASKPYYEEVKAAAAALKENGSGHIIAKLFVDKSSSNEKLWKKLGSQATPSAIWINRGDEFKRYRGYDLFTQEPEEAKKSNPAGVPVL